MVKPVGTVWGVSLLAFALFWVVAVGLVDLTTLLLGKPWRGVSYGIGVYYLSICLAVIGGLALLVSGFMSGRGGARWALGLGGLAIGFAVFTFLGQPSVLVRGGLSLLLSGLLWGAMILQRRVLGRR